MNIQSFNEFMTNPVYGNILIYLKFYKQSSQKIKIRIYIPDENPPLNWN